MALCGGVHCHALQVGRSQLGADDGEAVDAAVAADLEEDPVRGRAMRLPQTKFFQPPGRLEGGPVDLGSPSP